MRARCPLVTDCAAQGADGWYCPCRVRVELLAYAELLSTGSVVPSGGGGSSERVRGSRPAYTMQEEQVCKRADIAVTLAWLCREYPATGLAVAHAYGLRVDGLRVAFVGEVDDRGRVQPRHMGAIRIHWARSFNKPKPAHLLVVDLVGQGIEAMAYRLGWRPGLEGCA